MEDSRLRSVSLSTRKEAALTNTVSFVVESADSKTLLWPVWILEGIWRFEWCRPARPAPWNRLM